MLAPQRQNKILELLKKEEFVSIKKLQNLIDVSAMTLWRDLKTLEEQNLISRIHGGISLLEKESNQNKAGENHFMNKDVINRIQKDAITSYAAENFIAENDIIILEGGTTVASMINHIGQLPITILTNSMKVMNVACELHSDITLISSGGVLREKSRTLVGPTAEDFFNNYKSDTLFLSGVGFDIQAGITDPHPLDIQVKQAMINSSSRVIGLFDSTKFGKQSLMQVTPISSLDLLITDSGATEQQLEDLKSAGLEVIVVDIE